MKPLPKTKKIRDLIMDNTKMMKVYEKLHKEKYKFPYFFKIEKGGQVLYFVGTKHTTNPNSYSIKKIIFYWKKFLEKTGAKNCISLYEGGFRPLAKNPLEAVEKYGEPGLIVYLSYKDMVKSSSPEPNETWEINKIVKKYPREESIYYYFARTLDSYFRFYANKKEESLNSRLNWFFKKYQKITGWDDFLFNLTNFKKIHNTLHDHKFTFEDIKCYENDSHPGKNRIASESSILRNVYITKKILHNWVGGKNIFIVYGSGHAIVLKPALENLLK